MLEEKWITDRIPTEKFPHYTRANAGEVLADPVTPLGWTFGWESGIVLGCRDGFVSYGVFDADEYGDPPETFGLFGGYFYNCLTSARMMGVRMPGVTPEAIDDAYFDAHPDVPPYVAEDWHESERHSEKLAETGAYLLSAAEHPPIEEHKKIGIENKQAKIGKDEAIGISDEIEKIKKEYSFNNITILVRAIFQTREFEERFLKIGLPYRILGGIKFYERAEIKDCVAYLRLVYQEKDDLAFERIVNNPKRSIGDSTLKSIHEFAKKQKDCLEISSRKMIEENLIKPKAKIGLISFLSIIAILSALT